MICRLNASTVCFVSRNTHHTIDVAYLSESLVRLAYLNREGEETEGGERGREGKGRISHAVSPTALVYHCVEFPAQVVFPAVVKLIKCSRTSTMVETKNEGICAHLL